MNKIKVGIIGNGYTIGIARRHVEGYLADDRCSLVALYDIVPGRSAEWAAKHHLTAVKCCASLDEFFSLVDAVSICTPNDQHLPLVKAALAAGKHVLCEKPFAPNALLAKEAYDCALAHPDEVSLICFNYREIPAVKLMKRYIDSGAIGKVFTVRQKLGGARMADPVGTKLEWRMCAEHSGTGALGDFSCHMFDLVDYLLTPTEGPIETVTGLGGTFISSRPIIDGDGNGPVTNDDATAFVAKSRNGAIYSFLASRVSRPGHYFEISGEGGILVYSSDLGDDKLEVQLKDKNGAYQKGSKQIVSAEPELCTEEGHRGIIHAYITQILGEKKDMRDFAHGLYVQRLIDAVALSAKEGRSVNVGGLK